MEAKDREGMLLRMKQDCEQALKTMDAALLLHADPDMQNLREQWDSAAGAVATLLDVFYADPTKDLGKITHCILWFIIAHSGGMEEIEQALTQVITPRHAAPNTKLQRRGLRTRRP